MYYQFWPLGVVLHCSNFFESHFGVEPAKETLGQWEGWSDLALVPGLDCLHRSQPDIWKPDGCGDSGQCGFDCVWD